MTQTEGTLCAFYTNDDEPNSAAISDQVAAISDQVVMEAFGPVESFDNFKASITKLDLQELAVEVPLGWTVGDLRQKVGGCLLGLSAESDVLGDDELLSEELHSQLWELEDLWLVARWAGFLFAGSFFGTGAPLPIHQRPGPGCSVRRWRWSPYQHSAATLPAMYFSLAVW